MGISSLRFFRVLTACSVYNWRMVNKQLFYFKQFIPCCWNSGMALFASRMHFQCAVCPSLLQTLFSWPNPIDKGQCKQAICIASPFYALQVDLPRNNIPRLYAGTTITFQKFTVKKFVWKKAKTQGNLSSHLEGNIFLPLVDCLVSICFCDISTSLSSM